MFICMLLTNFVVHDDILFLKTYLSVFLLIPGFMKINLRDNVGYCKKGVAVLSARKFTKIKFVKSKERMTIR